MESTYIFEAAIAKQGIATCLIISRTVPSWSSNMDNYSPTFQIIPHPHTDHPIHPPSTKGDPFKIEFPEDLNCVLKIVEGIVHVYQCEEDVEKNKPVELPYPDRETFLADMNKLMALISNGPM